MADKRICSVDGCGKPVRARGWCINHYELWRRNGAPELKRAKNGDPHSFLSAALEYSDDDCLLWPFSLYSGGYGGMNYKGHHCAVHIIICEIVHGPKPEHGYEVAHGCGNKRCCNPRHLRWATGAENQADRIIHGTTLWGNKHPMAKLTEKDVREIRMLRGYLTQDKIAKMYGIAGSTVSQIQRRRGWDWLK